VAVVNEFGETIGILTFEDILDTVFTNQPSRSARLLNREPIEKISDGVWRVVGVTSLRRLARYLQMELPPSGNTTLAGMIQEILQRLPAEGDEGNWGQFHFRVLQTMGRAHVLVELKVVEAAAGEDEA
jgi:CBS domain containing-hemolysin-like protein